LSILVVRAFALPAICRRSKREPDLTSRRRPASSTSRGTSQRGLRQHKDMSLSLSSFPSFRLASADGRCRSESERDGPTNAASRPRFDEEDEEVLRSTVSLFRLPFTSSHSFFAVLRLSRSPSIPHPLADRCQPGFSSSSSSSGAFFVLKPATAFLSLFLLPLD
jgi:hypothetical protein